MSVEIKVPSLGESVTEATIGQWFKKVGDRVEADEPLVELETDKVTLEVNAPASGVLTDILAEEGADVEVGALLGVIGEGQGAAAAKPAEAPKKAEAPKPAPAAAPAAEKILSPAARKAAGDAGIDAGSVEGTGRDGRVMKDDVQRAAAAQPAAPVQSATPARPAAAPAAKAAQPAGERETRVRMTKLRRRIAERLKDAQNTAAILTTYNEVDMSQVMALRNRYKDGFEKKHGVKLGFMSFFVKAAIAGLKEYPAVNAQIDGDELIYKNHYDIGVAVGTEQGLVVPVVRDADQLSFAGVEATINALGVKARDGKLTMEELTGGTFTISNGGVYGSLMSSPILNPPQSGILGMHKIQERPMAEKGQVVIRPMMYLALSYDHRIIDGKEAVSFLVRVKECIENPERLLFDL
ncbi:2-oxoglutarate dehydrogenase complex dihydrolipoyllysine-residue succinyltransferase [Tistrella mobilis]|uniref:Dihydrolipoyllysine-residue succinyltransferase component of 2-oxoglutarate dehydrogenase complex n=1 Tax=Tistrella mobilis TaxID=171437 RepID=A0A162LQJ8_9PROT|nr:2-oxoglutarate dehydrogenase complex dihydrolipoyllysine-residue succinyltransferase [Tistrella mobilis]KYO56306.1 dihydrolipoamide succinyltransferase [Tistrella mobilis]